MHAPGAANDTGLVTPLLASVAVLPGVGEKTLALLRHLLGCDAPRVIDLLLHMPERVIERRACSRLSEIADGDFVIITGRVLQHRPPKADTDQPYRIAFALSGGPETVDVIHWGKGRTEFSKRVPVGSWRRISGKAKEYQGHWRIYPDHIEDMNAPSSIPLLEPVYPLTKGLSNNGVRKLILAALARVPEVLEWHDRAFLKLRNWPTFPQALWTIHRPQFSTDADASAPARTRLAFDELLARQIPLAQAAERMKRRRKRPVVGDGSKSLSIEFDFGHPLTSSQERALQKVREDLAKPHVTVRLIQGDVGSGKTMVALLAAATVAEAGRQTALMAPTELLARQHFDTMSPLAAAAGMRLSLLTGKTPTGERRALLDALAAAELDMVIGTHALLEPEVMFEELALAIIDEQQRFGRDQRIALVKKGTAVDGLLLSATPIPQTMALAEYGGIAVTELRQKPAGRKPVITTCTPADKVDGVIQAVGRAIDVGRRVFWVAPLVEKSSRTELTAASGRYEDLRARFGERVSLVHGRMGPAEKDEAMDRFQSGEAGVLVATTVIETGIDVPEANVMIIEHAERFGLSQLHQLRGRVGRGSEQAYCILLHDTDAQDASARARLDILRQTNDGFRIAEEDLRIRGAGDLLGARQSGTADYRVADLTIYGDLLKAAVALAAELFQGSAGFPIWRKLFDCQ